MKRPFVLVTVVLLLITISAGFGWQGRPDAQAQGGGGQTVNLPIVMRMPTLTPTATLVPTVTPTVVPPNPGTIIRISVASDGSQANNRSSQAAISADGRYIAFLSRATNLVENDTNGFYDVFLRDTATNTTSRVSVAEDGAQANGSSDWVSLSTDGRIIAFDSTATNLISGDTNRARDVFVRNLEGGPVERISNFPYTGPEEHSFTPSLSSDGRYVAFASIAGSPINLPEVFLYDRQTAQMEYIARSYDGSAANGSSLIPHISGDGRYVSFTSFASNLVPNDTNLKNDVFVRDRLLAQTRRPSSNLSGASGNQESGGNKISLDGHFIVFDSLASDLVAGDTNNMSDVFVYDQQSQTVTRVSIGANGVQANGDSDSARLSSDGRYVIFSSTATNLIPNDTNGVRDVFLRDLQTGEIIRLSIALDGSGANGNSYPEAFSADGRYVLFNSEASNLVPNDTNGVRDLFLYDRNAATP